MEVLTAQLMNGIAVGSIYALVVTGFNLMFLVGGVVQYAYPHIVVISMYVAWMVLESTSGNLVPAIPAAIVSAIGLSVLTEPLFRPVARREAGNQSFVLAIGISMILTFVMAKHINHGMPISFPGNLASNDPIIRFGIAAVSKGHFYTFMGTILVVAAFLYILYRTMPGRAFRAMAQDRFVAELLGIPITRTAVASYGLAGLLAGITAIFLAMAMGSAYPALGNVLALKVLATVLFAGVGNLKGGLVCGLLLGIAEGLAAGYLPGHWSNAVAFGMIMTVVLFRPEGLFGLRT